jgi:hypothetical protein
MKQSNLTKLTTVALALILTISASHLFAQTGNGIFFQAVARDNFSNPAKDRKIYVQTSIIQTTTTGTKLLTEEHQATTDATGVFNISIGNGTRVGGTASSLANINWSNGPFFLNLKVSITPIGVTNSWDYSKEWIDMGTTSFGAVPYSYYAANVAGFDTKLNISDSTKYVTPAKLAAKTFDTTSLSNRINLKASTTDVTSSLSTKLNIADSATKYVTPAQLASYNFSTGAVTIDTSSLSNRINFKADASTVTTSLNLKANATDVTSALNLKADAADLTAGLALKANTSSLATVATSGDYNDLANKPTIAGSYTLPIASASNLGGIKVGTNLSIDGSGVLSANISSGSINATSLNTGTITATSVNTPIYVSTPQTLTDGSIITWDPALGLNANVTLGGNRTLSFSSTPPSGSYGTIVITQDATGGRTITLPSTTNKVLGSTSTTSIALSTAAGAKDILNFYYDGTNCFWNIGQGYGTAATSASTNLATSVTGTLAVANGGTGATTLTGLVKGAGTSAFTSAVAGTDYLAPNGSAASLTNFPTFNQNTTGNAATVTTNANLNGDVTSVGNSSTVVKINGTSLASLSTGILKNTTSTGVPTIAVAGTDYQEPITLTTTGTGAATLSGTTLNIPAVSSTVNAGSISGTIAVANGGTGATTLTGLIKGTGTNALTAAVAGTDYQAPLNLTTTGNGAAT